MPSDWEFLVLDTKDTAQVFCPETGAEEWTYGVVDRLPLSAVTMTWGISGQPGDLKATIDIDDPVALYLDPPRHLLIAERNHRPEWGGVIWDVGGAITDELVSLSAGNYWTYFQNRCELRQDVDYSVTPMEQYAMVTEILYRATIQQPAATGTLKLSWRSGNTGVNQYGPQIKAIQSQKVGGLVEQQCAIDQGMEFQVRPLKVDDRYLFLFDLAYPRLGRATPYVLNYGSAIGNGAWSKVGGRVVNDWQSAGQPPKKSASSAAPLANAVSAQSLSRYPRLMGSDQVQNSVQARVTADANYQLAVHRFSVQVTSLDLVPDRADTDRDLFTLGDTVRAVIQRGPLDVDLDLRIGAMSMALTDLGDQENPLSKAENLQLTVVQDQVTG